MTDATPQTLVTYYLHMTTRDAFRPAMIARDDVMITPFSRVDLAYYRFLYEEVGRTLRWRDRLIMPDEALAAALADASIRVLYVGGAPAGYVELSAPDTDHAIEIAYFGIRPEYYGGGLGKHLLSVGIAQAWDAGAARVWVHTCNLDHPHALENYQKRGFSIYDTREEPMPALYL